MLVKVTAPKADGREIETNVDIPEELNALIEKYGESVVADGAVRSIRIQSQGYIRQMLEAGQSDEEIHEAAAAWVPGAGRDSFASVVAKVKNMDDEKKKALMAALGLA